MRLAGRRVLVCGGATGIGAAVARLSAAEGAHVWIHYRTRQSAAASLREEIHQAGGSADVVHADLTTEEGTSHLAAAVGELHGCVHSIAPPLPRASFDATPWAVYQQHWETSVKALWSLMTRLLRTTSSLDSVVAVLSSSMLTTPPRDAAAYLAAKHALHGLCRSLAVELAPRSVRVNCVSPGLTPSPLTSHIDARHHEILARSVPLGRLGTAMDAAQAIVFLLSPESAFITGVNLPVTGGAALT